MISVVGCNVAAGGLFHVLVLQQTHICLMLQVIAMQVALLHDVISVNQSKWLCPFDIRLLDI